MLKTITIPHNYFLNKLINMNKRICIKKSWFLLLLLLSCSDSVSDQYCCLIDPEYQSTIYEAQNSLKDLASFPIGNVVSANKIQSNNEFISVLLNDFNSITAENDMKMRNMFIGPNEYDFTDGDLIVSFAKENGIRVFGHALIWHSSIPDWLQNFSGTDLEFEEQVENYIKATVHHFSEQKMIIDGEEVSVVAGWDVVNEAFTSQAENAIFKQRIGSDYLKKCFLWAREADPEVKLFYNDYGLESNTNKLSLVLNMIDEFRNDNVPIDGIGLQMHIDHISPLLLQIDNNLQAIINKDILIHFSELDITVNRNNDITDLTYERAESQENRYRDIVNLYLNVPPLNRFGITLWGMRDIDSWLLNHYNNPNEYPLLFNPNYETKLSHRGFAEGLQ